MYLQPTGRTHWVFLCLLLSSGCAWTPESPEANPQAVATNAPVAQARVTLPAETSTEPPANAPAVTAETASDDVEETTPEKAGCHASKPGQIVGFEEFYAATLRGGEGERLFISTAPGAEPGESYGLAGDSVEAIATALDGSCTKWTWVKWPKSDYRGWLPESSVELNRTQAGDVQS